MAWELLPVDYTNATWSGLKRYNQVDNEDGTVSFQDVTEYTNKEKSFFGALEANRMNEALNTIMSMLENGTDLYEAFQNYFDEQKELFETATDETSASFLSYIADLQESYQSNMETFESTQQQIFTAWFQAMKDQLSADAAGNLQNEVDEVTEDVFNRYYGLDASQTEFLSDGSIRITNSEATITVVFTSTDEGEKVITETIVPTDGYYNYVKTTTITPATSTTNKTIVEKYSSEMKS